jgi:hypothetical protein
MLPGPGAGSHRDGLAPCVRSGVAPTRCRTMRFALALNLSLMACSPAPGDALALCGDAACRQQRLLGAFDAAPGETLALLGGLEPVEQEALVRTLAEQRPDALELGCDRLERGSPAWSLCARSKARPHLVRGRKDPAAQGPPVREAAGPASRHPVVPPPRGAVPKDSAAACAERSSGLPASQAECLFQHAEALAQAEGWRASERVVALCVAAGDFVHGCMHHSLAMMLPPVPAADRVTSEDLIEATQALSALEAAVGEELAASYRSFFWSLWTLHAFRAAQRVDGRALAVLPSEAHPHVRMAAAFRWLQLERHPEPDLEAWTRTLEAALAQPGEPRPGSRHAATLWKARDFWPDDLRAAGEQHVPAAFCLGPGRRPVSEDPREDLQLALLEASARLAAPPDAAFYADLVQRSESPLLRWTSVRLLGALYPDALAALDLSAAPPLVRARAAQPLRER